MTNLEELATLYAALLVMADVDPWEHKLRKEIATMQEQDVDLIQVSKTLRDAFEKGIEKGRREAVDELLRQMFIHRVGRPLTEQEQQALAARAAQNGQGPAEVQARALSLEGEALAVWLLDPTAK